MSRSVTFGVVGGYGATGKVVVSELWKSCNGEILIGGRSLEKGKAFAAEFKSRVSAAQVDVLNPRSLDDFCSQCSIVVNCGGPVMVLQDRVAQAAFRGRCHYVDVAGLSFVKERMQARSREMEDSGLSFVVSAGWMPGLSELLPVHAYALARAKMDTVESLKVYFGDCGEWSDNALRDGVWYLRQLGLRRPGYFRKGKWVRAKISEASCRVDLGNPVGPGRFSLFSTPELNEIGRRLTDCDVFIYSYLSGFRTALAAVLLALLPLPQGIGVRLLRSVFRRNRLAVGGFVAVQVLGSGQGHRLALTAQIVFEKHRDYWIHGLVAAVVARMVSEGKGIQPGVHFLADAVEPDAFLVELRKSGVEQTENLEHTNSRGPI